MGNQETVQLCSQLSSVRCPEAVSKIGSN